MTHAGPGIVGVGVDAVDVVRFRRLAADDIDGYLASGEWRGKAGGYAIQGRAACFVAFLSGSYSNVVGLPLFETAALLRAITPAAGAATASET